MTKVREEHLESADRVFVRKGGKVPTRQINGAQLRMRVSSYTRDPAAALGGRGVVHAQADEFIVPDVPTWCKVHGTSAKSADIRHRRTSLSRPRTRIRFPAIRCESNL
jgi:hypothetical protein